MTTPWFDSRFDSNSNRSRRFDSWFNSNENIRFAGPYTKQQLKICSLHRTDFNFYFYFNVLFCTIALQIRNYNVIMLCNKLTMVQYQQTQLHIKHPISGISSNIRCGWLFSTIAYIQNKSPILLCIDFIGCFLCQQQSKYNKLLNDANVNGTRVGKCYNIVSKLEPPDAWHSTGINL